MHINERCHTGRSPLTFLFTSLWYSVSCPPPSPCLPHLPLTCLPLRPCITPSVPASLPACLPAFCTRCHCQRFLWSPCGNSAYPVNRHTAATGSARLCEERRKKNIVLVCTVENYQAVDIPNLKENILQLKSISYIVPRFFNRLQ